ncbi:hypothetical protein GCM10025865_11240 [Paraoerskovia sediminicola]|uniref:ABC transporter domain-containing protein n=1 Tax=Paraoerskovia sediminicola TaxID=1138587 RepID=A0ABM8G159_9CELL|nr:ATP-binding cassette domain-containing protein [Paraoerskovia sediminicola]BDZ41825.1 hypothetical protein GCM10025865_11240 [Paraoerskovia sediminicola]
MDLHLENITLVYPDGDTTLTAVDDVSLTVASGTTTALLGPSGSGKSSLLAVAGGLTHPTSGTVRFGDEAEPVFTTDTPATPRPGPAWSASASCSSSRSSSRRSRRSSSSSC